MDETRKDRQKTMNRTRGGDPEVGEEPAPGHLATVTDEMHLLQESCGWWEDGRGRERVGWCWGVQEGFRPGKGEEGKGSGRDQRERGKSRAGWGIKKIRFKPQRETVSSPKEYTQIKTFTYHLPFLQKNPIFKITLKHKNANHPSSEAFSNIVQLGLQ